MNNLKPTENSAPRHISEDVSRQAIERGSRIHYLQHVPFEGLGHIQAWLNSHDCRLSSTRLFDTAALPRQDEFDGLIVLGGPMSANDTGIHPWLAEEIRFLADTVAAAKPILGICLGAQLLARALGAAVYRNKFKEVGWHPVQRCDSAGAQPFPFPPQATVFQWHGETFDLPAAAVRLATGPACANQAFLFGEQVLGLQFHLETTPEAAQALIHHCGDDLEPGPYTQSPDSMLAEESRFAEGHRLMDDILRYLFLGGYRNGSGMP